jgi:glycosyltransferase involved in cell wall biosynthesis
LSTRPRFSVIVAAFNAARWIAPTIRSALAQTYADREIIVVGDGCTDETGQILRTCFGDAVRWINLERNHGGQSAPNNEGIRLARGTHIAYLGHDDIWSPRHLEALAETVGRADPDFVVSGAVYHGPPGSRYYQITGLFDDPAAPAREFFPPSSFAHRREAAERIGFWRAPEALRAPADCDFLLRAVAERCSFASTRTITVHKFAAGHRYLSYLFSSGEEQQRMLECLSAGGGEERVLAEIDRDIADGADHPPILYPDFEHVEAGKLFHRNRRIKGLERSALVIVERSCRMSLETSAAGLDWYTPERDRFGRQYRWSGPNPNPLYLVNARVSGRFMLWVHVLRFATEELMESLRIDVGGRECAFFRNRNSDGSFAFTVGPVPEPMENGVVLRFRMPYCARLGDDPARRRVGLALSGFELATL